MMTPISMVTFSIILPVSTNGRMSAPMRIPLFPTANGTVGSYEVELYGTKGPVRPKTDTIIAGDDSWRYRGENNDMYQTEHDELFASIRNANPFNDGEKSAHSTMVAILGRMASYTGQKSTYEDALNSKEDLTPPHGLG